MIKDYFSFSKNQKIAIISIILAIILSWSFYFYIPSFYQSSPKIDSLTLNELALQIKPENSFFEEKTQEPSKLTPFTFDPNTLDSLGFAKMGLRPKLIHTILNYRNKGGHFYSKEDVKKMYGLKDEEYVQMESYIQINSVKNKWNQTAQQANLHIEINSADTSELVKLNGIGAKLSMNIIQYRKQLGGFYTINQLNEVYGISPETFTKIKNQIWVNQSKIQKINLNEITYNELNQHPYFKGNLCKEIIDLRKKKDYHLENIEEIKEIALINDEIFRKIAPYIIVK